MRLFLNLLGLVLYAVSLYLMFGHDVNYSSPFHIVGGDAYNHNYKFLGAIVLSLMGTGFIVMATSFPSNPKLLENYPELTGGK